MSEWVKKDAYALHQSRTAKLPLCFVFIVKELPKENYAISINKTCNFYHKTLSSSNPTKRFNASLSIITFNSWPFQLIHTNMHSCTILSCTILSCTILSCTILSCTILSCTVSESCKRTTVSYCIHEANDKHFNQKVLKLKIAYKIHSTTYIRVIIFSISSSQFFTLLFIITPESRIEKSFILIIISVTKEIRIDDQIIAMTFILI